MAHFIGLGDYDPAGIARMRKLCKEAGACGKACRTVFEKRSRPTGGLKGFMIDERDICLVVRWLGAENSKQAAWLAFVGGIEDCIEELAPNVPVRIPRG